MRQQQTIGKIKFMKSAVIRRNDDDEWKLTETQLLDINSLTLRRFSGFVLRSCRMRDFAVK